MLSMEAKEEQVCRVPRKFFIRVSPNLYLELIRYAMPMMPTIRFSLFYVPVLFHFFLASTMYEKRKSYLLFLLDLFPMHLMIKSEKKKLVANGSLETVQPTRERFNDCLHLLQIS